MNFRDVFLVKLDNHKKMNTMYTRYLKIRVQRNKAERQLPGAELCLLKEMLFQFC